MSSTSTPPICSNRRVSSNGDYNIPLGFIILSDYFHSFSPSFFIEATNMPLRNLPGSRLRVAIIGAGPAGLGAAIEFAKLPFVDWNLYEQAVAIREIGAGISVQPSTWRMLEVMGAAANLKHEDFYRTADKHSVQHR